MTRASHQQRTHYHQPDLSLELLAQAVPNLNEPSVLWQPLMSEVRRLPGFKDLPGRLGFVDYWRVHPYPGVSD